MNSHWSMIQMPDTGYLLASFLGLSHGKPPETPAARPPSAKSP